jgi:hypothetical protein
MKSKLASLALAVLATSMLAAACQKVDLPREKPSSPEDSYKELPK